MKFNINLSSLILLPFILLFIFAFRTRQISEEYNQISELNPNEKLVEDAIDPPCENLQERNYISKLKIETPQSRKWQFNIIKGYIDNLSEFDNVSIKDKYKKRFDAFIYYKTNEKTCKNKSRIRISGDIRDHIKLVDGTPVSSLDVTMKTGNINGIRRFKLFLPRTRGGDNEVFIANLFSEFGLISPRTMFMDVEINNFKHKMIFQEKLAKELVEFNKLRESSLIKANESLMWQLRRKTDKSSIFNSYVYPSIINNKWLSKGEENLKIGIKALNLFSTALNDASKDYIHYDIPLNISLLNNTNKNHKIFKDHSFFDLLSIASRSLHGHFKHNLRYYYDPFHDSLRPVYYDGGSDILDSRKLPFIEFLEYEGKTNNDDKHLAMLTINNDNYDFPDAIKRINNLNIISFKNKLKKSGLIISEEQISNIKEKLLDNINYLYFLNENIKKNSSLKKIFKKEGEIKDKNLIQTINKVNLISGENFINLRVCDIYSKNCFKSNISKEDFIKVSRGNYQMNEKKYFYFNNNKNASENKKELNYRNYKINDFINIRAYGNPQILIKKEEREIEIKFKSNADKIIFHDSNISEWKIYATADKNLLREEKTSRIDSNLITGSLVIRDSMLENISLFFENGINEDSINIIRSIGSIKEIFVKNSFQDAIDLDFSDLNIQKIKVEEAGNDCLDLSSGNYQINELIAFKCYDKGISVGESSSTEIKNLFVNKSSIAIVVKDSSRAKILNVEVIDSDKCLALYRKKEEFSGSYLLIPKKVCKENIFVQKNSILNFL
tara:strand:- start:195 stop:2540 length:2346 start_codon:yes stop_codon:yes gene_type:complete